MLLKVCYGLPEAQHIVQPNSLLVSVIRLWWHGGNQAVAETGAGAALLSLLLNEFLIDRLNMC